MVSDLPQVNSLFMNNCCILFSGFCVAAVPLCSNYYSYVAVAIFFGLFVSGYVSLTSIILVDLLGLDCLTNAFGLLILFRGAASIVGAPLAGKFLLDYLLYVNQRRSFNKKSKIFIILFQVLFSTHSSLMTSHFIWLVDFS